MIQKLMFQNLDTNFENMFFVCDQALKIYFVVKFTFESCKLEITFLIIKQTN